MENVCEITAARIKISKHDFNIIRHSIWTKIGRKKEFSGGKL